TGTGGPNAELRASLNTQLTNAQIATAEAKNRLERIQKGSLDAVTSIVSADALNNSARSGVINFAMNNSDLVRLRAQYRDATSKLAEVTARVGSQHEIALKLSRQADDLKTAIQIEERRIADAYVNEYQVAAAREAELAASAA